jgi:hypothetical protein
MVELYQRQLEQNMFVSNLKKILMYYKALQLYFLFSEKRYWYRKSTKEWVLEVKTNFPEEYYATCRYSNTFLVFTNFIWLWLFWGTVNDLLEFVEKKPPKKEVSKNL